MLRVNFENNVNRNGSVGLHVDDPSCHTLKMEDVEFRSNQYKRSAQLSLQNELESVRLIRNKVIRNDTSECRLLSFTRESNSVVKEMLAEENTGTVLAVFGAAIRISRSSFKGNSKSEGDVIAENSALDIDTIFSDSTSCGGCGTAVSLFDGSNATFSFVRFVNNVAYDSGGAVYLRGSSANFASVRFVNNFASLYGGAVSLWDGCKATFSSVRFVNNSADEFGGGAASIRGGSNAIFSSVRFVNNSAEASGGAVLLRGGSANFSFVRFLNDFADLDGAAVYLYNHSNATFSKVRFVNDFADFFGGVVRLDFFSNATFSNVCFVNTNRDVRRYAVLVEDDSNVTLSSVRFLENAADDGGDSFLFDGRPNFSKFVLSTTPVVKVETFVCLLGLHDDDDSDPPSEL